MNFMNKMERKFGRYAIPNLMYYIVILYAVGVLVQMMAPAFYIQYLMLDARAILHGQIWRVVTFMIWPPSGSLFFNLIAIYLYYNLGMTLERVWGTFRFNVYFFMGVIGHVLAALLIYIITGQVYILTTDYLNFSLFFAFAATFPEMQFYLFFVLPIKAKYLALFDGLYFYRIPLHVQGEPSESKGNSEKTGLSLTDARGAEDSGKDRTPPLCCLRTYGGGRPESCIPLLLQVRRRL